MKRIVTIFTLSLVMCLTMAFPASAATYTLYTSTKVSDFQRFYNYCMASSKRSAYPYYAFFAKDNGASADSYCAVFSKSANPALREQVIYFQSYASSPDTGLYKNGVTCWFDSWQDFGAVTVRLYDKIADSSPMGYGSSVYFPEISTLQISLFYKYGRSLNGFIPYVPPVSTSELQTLITQAKAKQNIGYTQESWNALQAQITAAENVMANASKTQTQVDNAKNALQAALNNLILLPPPLPDTNELFGLIAEAETIEDIGYTVVTWTRLTNAIVSCYALLSRSDYTDDDVYVASLELRSAINGLTLYVPPSPDPPKPSPSPLGYDLATGDVSGYLDVVPRIYYNYIDSSKPIIIGIAAIVISILLVPRMLSLIFPRLKR